MPSRCNFPSLDLDLITLPAFPGFSLPAIPVFTLAFALACPLD